MADGRGKDSELSELFTGTSYMKISTISGRMTGMSLNARRNFLLRGHSKDSDAFCAEEKCKHVFRGKY